MTTVIAERAGSGNGTPLVVIAHRDAIGAGAAGAAVRDGRAARAGAGAGAQRDAADDLPRLDERRHGRRRGRAGLPRPHRGPLRRGDRARATLPAPSPRKPYVYPFSAGPGSAPLLLERTVAEAIAQQAGVDPGAPTAARPAGAPGLSTDARRTGTAAGRGRARGARPGQRRSRPRRRPSRPAKPASRASARAF